MSSERISYLFYRHYEKTASPAERTELMQLIQSGVYHEALKTGILDVLTKEKGDYKLSHAAAEQILSAILQKGVDSLVLPSSNELAESRNFTEESRAFRISWIPKLAAASAIVLASLLGYHLWDKDAGNGETPISLTGATADLPPGKDKAMLSLSNGTRLDLDSPDTEALLRQLGISNDHNKGELTYRSTSATIGYSTLTTPFGGQYKLVLPDGSKAWLNAGSMLTFPNTFEKDRRTIEMSGEIYFEIAPDPAKPFIVTVKSTADQKETEVKVLGTHFNISSYSDEPQIKTTLLEGSVEIARNGISKRLHPGQQAQIEQRSREPAINIKSVDAVNAVAWKDGRFEFNDNIKDIMRQIARWYDVEIVYEGDVGSKSFAGTIPRKNQISDVLKMLELTDGIRFKIEGRTIIVRAVPI